MSDPLSRQNQHGLEDIPSESHNELFQALTTFISSNNPAILIATFNRLLAPEIYLYAQECLEKKQNIDEVTDLILKTVLDLLHDAQLSDLDTIIARYLTEKEDAINALEKLESAAQPEDFYSILVEQQQTLLSDLALVFLTIYHDTLEMEEDILQAESIKQHLHLLKSARKLGVSLAWQHAQAENKQVGDALDLLEEQVTYETFYAFLQAKHDLLITEKAVWLLQLHAGELRQQNDPMAEHYETHAFLLKDACTRGLAEAWKDFAEADGVIQAIQQADEPTEILKIMQAHEKVLCTETALAVLQSYIAQAKASGNAESVQYFVRWLRLVENMRHSGIISAWNTFYINLYREIYRQQAFIATQRISDTTISLGHLTPGTLEWANILSDRATANYSHTLNTDNQPESASRSYLEQAASDYRDALSVYRKYGDQGREADMLNSLGLITFLYMIFNQNGHVDLTRAMGDFFVSLVGTSEDTHSPFHDPDQRHQQAIDYFTMALDLYSQQERPTDCARVLLQRATTYRVGNMGSEERTFRAIDDYTAALSILNKETSPVEWQAAVGNRGTCYLTLMGDGYEERLIKAIADLKSALSVCTRQASPAPYRKLYLFLSQAYERLGDWGEAYKAIKEVIAVQRDLLAMNPEENSRTGLIADVANVQIEIYIRAAQILLHLQQPLLTEVTCLLEEGRAQKLRLMLSLDMLDPEQISDPPARRRAENFLVAQKIWQQHQRELVAATAKSARPGVEQKQIEEDYTSLRKTIEAIRAHDDTNFMSPAPRFDDILQAVTTPETALVYLAAGIDKGLALLIIRTKKGNTRTLYVPLPYLKSKAILALIATDTTTHMPIKLERSLAILGELGLDDVTEALERNEIQKVRLITFGFLSLFPFPSIQVQSIRGGKKYLGELFEVTIAPSAQALEASEKRAASLSRSTSTLLLAGDPYPRPQKVRALPYARAEARALQQIAADFGYTEPQIRYLRPADITRKHIVSALQNTWYAHLAIHGVYHPDNPGASRLLLAGDSSISLREILERKIVEGGEALNLEGIRLLVLSACETALIDVKQTPDEFIGFAAGFLQAGAASVIASLWAVDDRATFLLMCRFAQFYLDQQNKDSPAGALAKAQRWLREEATYRVLMNYKPFRDFSANRTNTEIRALRLLDHQDEHNHENRSSPAMPSSDLDALPYTDPMYWAGFVVTGC